jgi:hypothetical protein
MEKVTPFWGDWRPDHRKKKSTFFVPFERGRSNVAADRLNWILGKVLANPSGYCIEPSAQFLARMVEA